MPLPTFCRPTCWSTRCGAAIAPGRECGSICSTSRRNCVPARSPWIPTPSLMTGASGLSPPRAEDALQLISLRDLELVVPAVLGFLVRTPPQEHSAVSEPIALHVVVLHPAHTFDSERLPREILAGAPPALTAWHARHVCAVTHGPVAPRMSVEGISPQRRQLDRKCFARRHREG